ncbi:glycosyl transferase [Aliidongia dinghuensis]|uniref:Glycosyl transferase n=1 Tax=Aliidongia dinghuensis TaxID=1867774 RepID=A0A8J2YSN9_9PROT|nr:TIGR03087 family PEP-CTERM/XrtA system glycosyltransferase [Aliidongia dinghuensis]GGF10910.1 glycosyl transferase [Aliidongia dinghuensis]
MAEVLFLCQRIPFPPNKGDKIRSFNILRHLAERHTVRVGSFVDDPADWQYAEPLKAHCAELFLAPLTRRWATLRSASGLIDDLPLSVPFYRDRRLAAWVARTLARTPADAVFVFSSAMAQYVPEGPMRPRRFAMDFVDVDAMKWAAYAETKHGAAGWIYRREARKLLAHDRRVAERADISLFVSDREAELFRGLAPESAGRVHALSNGVDSAYFDPGQVGSADATASSPRPRLVFTGAMDYWPNVEAVVWFADHILPGVQARHPEARFQIVGLNPDKRVQELAGRPGIEVTGRVPDVRPYLAGADAVVAPMGIARGIQNKILEAMAMARPVVVSPEGLEGIAAADGREVLTAEREPAAFLARTLAALDPATSHPIAAAARAFVLERFSWDSTLDRLDRHIFANGGGN